MTALAIRRPAVDDYFLHRQRRADQVYRAYLRDGRLLYVGCTDDLYRRLREHCSHSAWWRLAARLTVERCRTRTEALAVESRALLTESPIFNYRGIALPPLNRRWIFRRDRAELQRQLLGYGAEQVAS